MSAVYWGWWEGGRERWARTQNADRKVEDRSDDEEQRVNGTRTKYERERRRGGGEGGEGVEAQPTCRQMQSQLAEDACVPAQDGTSAMSPRDDPAALSPLSPSRSLPPVSPYSTYQPSPNPVQHSVDVSPFPSPLTSHRPVPSHLDLKHTCKARSHQQDLEVMSEGETVGVQMCVRVSVSVRCALCSKNGGGVCLSVSVSLVIVCLRQSNFVLHGPMPLIRFLSLLAGRESNGSLSFFHSLTFSRFLPFLSPALTFPCLCPGSKAFEFLSHVSSTRAASTQWRLP